jgi:hypothetical protein
LVQGYAFYQHEFANGRKKLYATLSQTSSPFSFQTDGRERDYALLGVNFIVKIKKNLLAPINYDHKGWKNKNIKYINAGLCFEF